MCQIVNDQKLHLLSVIVCALTKHPDGALYIVCTVFADGWIGEKWSQTFFFAKTIRTPILVVSATGAGQEGFATSAKVLQLRERGGGGGGGEIQSSTIQEILWKCQKRWPGNFILIYDAQTLLLRSFWFGDFKQKKWLPLLHRGSSHQHWPSTQYTFTIQSSNFVTILNAWPWKMDDKRWCICNSKKLNAN